MHEYLDKVVKTYQFAKYLDDIGIATKTETQLIHNNRAVFTDASKKCHQKSGTQTDHQKTVLWSHGNLIFRQNNHH